MNKHITMQEENPSRPTHEQQCCTNMQDQTRTTSTPHATEDSSVSHVTESMASPYSCMAISPADLDQKPLREAIHFLESRKGLIHHEMQTLENEIDTLRDEIVRLDSEIHWMHESESSDRCMYAPPTRSCDDSCAQRQQALRQHIAFATSEASEIERRLVLKTREMLHMDIQYTKHTQMEKQYVLFEKEISALTYKLDRIMTQKAAWLDELDAIENEAFQPPLHPSRRRPPPCVTQSLEPPHFQDRTSSRNLSLTLQPTIHPMTSQDHALPHDRESTSRIHAYIVLPQRTHGGSETQGQPRRHDIETLEQRRRELCELVFIRETTWKELRVQLAQIDSQLEHRTTQQQLEQVTHEKGRPLSLDVFYDEPCKIQHGQRSTMDASDDHAFTRGNHPLCVSTTNPCLALDMKTNDDGVAPPATTSPSHDILYEKLKLDILQQVSTMLKIPRPSATVHDTSSSSPSTLLPSPPLPSPPPPPPPPPPQTQAQGPLVVHRDNAFDMTSRPREITIQGEMKDHGQIHAVAHHQVPQSPHLNISCTYQAKFQMAPTMPCPSMTVAHDNAKSYFALDEHARSCP